MLIRKFDKSLRYRYVMYGRMSDPKQNARSPDQQFATITGLVQSSGNPWQLVKTYRDDGISGRYMKKRPSFQTMLRDIEVGLIKTDLIVVDTLERLGRHEEIVEVRRKLFQDHGVLVVTADSGFADPTGPTGQALGFVENIRSTEDGRIKANDVVRGKVDAVKLKRWPGGPPPLGFKLKAAIDNAVTPPALYRVLDPIVDRIAAVQLLFQRADETGHGRCRLAKWWNTCPAIPADLKPISEHTIGYILRNKIYIGTLEWGVNSTGIVNDTRVVERNPDGPLITVTEFCDAVVDPEVFDRVQDLGKLRGDSIRAGRKAKVNNEPEKLIAPQARGLTLKYLLTGLVRCGCCNASMRPVPSRHTTESGRVYAYTHYACPRAHTGACENSRYFREDKLRVAVVDRLRHWLFPLPEEKGQVPVWFPGLVELVRQDLDRYRAAEPNRAAARDAEMREIADRLAGWMMALGDPRLSAAVRCDITAKYEQAKARQAELEAAAGEDQAIESYMRQAFDPKCVIEQLHRLDEVLAGCNPTLGNLELSKHIDTIRCYPDDRVEMRGTWLGVFGGAVDLLSRGTDTPATNPTPGSTITQVNPRKRGRLRIPNLSASANSLTNVDTCLDPERFVGIADAFFWSESLPIERDRCWAETHAAEVAAARATGMTHEALCDRFGVTPPTIRNALRYAKKNGAVADLLPRKMPRARWEEHHYGEVAELRQQGMSMQDLCLHFLRSEPLIRAALKLAAKARPTPMNEPEDPTPTE